MSACKLCFMALDGSTKGVNVKKKKRLVLSNLEIERMRKLEVAAAEIK